MPDTGGPYVTAAMICERVLTEQDGALSAIRIIDRVFFITDSDGTPLQPQQPITFVLMFKSGSARGTVNVQLRAEKPSGEQAPVAEANLLMEGEDRGANLVLSAGFEPDQQGLYWYDVLVEGEVVTRMPLRAVYQPLPSGPSGA